MACRLRMALRCIPANSLLLLVLACRAGNPEGGAPDPQPSSAWSAPACLIEDRSPATADTLLVVGAGARVTPRPEPFDCEGARWPLGAPPVLLLDDRPAEIDARDLLEVGSPARNHRRPDVMVTHDPAVLAFARQRAEYITAPLPWGKTYVMMAAPASAASPVPSTAERESLAHDVVSVSARGAREPFPWLADSSCAVASRPGAPTAALIAYVRDDAVARALAERVVSLAASGPRDGWLAFASPPGGPGTLRAIPMAEAAIPAALAEGRVRAAVLQLARDPRTRCGFRSVGRLHAGTVPLIDTREHVIVRRGSGAAVLVAPDGSLHFFRRTAR